MINYSWRITKSDIKAYKDIMSISSLIVYEDFDKHGKPTQPHFHGLFQDNRKIEQVRKLYFTKRKDNNILKGNKQYQLKVCEDVEETKKYFFKGIAKGHVPSPIVNREKISESEYHEKYWQRYEELTKLNKTKKNITTCERYWSLCESKIKKMLKFQCKLICVEIIMTQYKGKKSLMGKYQMEGIIDYLFMRYLIEVRLETMEKAATYIAEEKYGYTGAPYHNMTCCCKDD